MRSCTAENLRLADVPYRVHDLGYDAVELQDMFLWPKPPNPIARALGRQAREFNRYEYDRKALMRTRLHRLRSGTRLICWSIDSDLTANEGPDRQKQKGYLAAAIEAADYLGAPLIRITLGGEKERSGGVRPRGGVDEQRAARRDCAERQVRRRESRRLER